MVAQSANTQIPERTWNGIYNVGGISGLIAIAFGTIQVMINIISVGVMRIPVPANVLDWFALLQTHRLIGLNDLTVFQIPFFVFCVPMFLALYVALYRTNPATLTIAMIFAILGLAVYLASNTVFSILSLSNQYAAATTDFQRSVSLAAGQAMFAIYEGVGLDVGLSLFMIAVFIISVAMFRSTIFSPIVAYVGILASLVSLAYYISTAFMPNAIYIFEVTALLFFIWVILISQRLLQLREKDTIEYKNFAARF